MSGVPHTCWMTSLRHALPSEGVSATLSHLLPSLLPFEASCPSIGSWLVNMHSKSKQARAQKGVGLLYVAVYT